MPSILRLKYILQPAASLYCTGGVLLRPAPLHHVVLVLATVNLTRSPSLFAFAMLLVKFPLALVFLPVRPHVPAQICQNVTLFTVRKAHNVRSKAVPQACNELASVNVTVAETLHAKAVHLGVVAAEVTIVLVAEATGITALELQKSVSWSGGEGGGGREA